MMEFHWDSEASSLFVIQEAMECQSLGIARKRTAKFIKLDRGSASAER